MPPQNQPDVVQVIIGAEEGASYTEQELAAVERGSARIREAVAAIYGIPGGTPGMARTCPAHCLHTHGAFAFELLVDGRMMLTGRSRLSWCCDCKGSQTHTEFKVEMVPIQERGLDEKKGEQERKERRRG